MGEIWHADSSNIGLYMCKKWIEKVEVIWDIFGEFHWFPKCNLSRENALIKIVWTSPLSRKKKCVKSPPPPPSFFFFWPLCLFLEGLGAFLLSQSALRSLKTFKCLFFKWPCPSKPLIRALVLLFDYTYFCRPVWTRTAESSLEVRLETRVRPMESLILSVCFAGLICQRTP